jgi:hypothetical protein
VVKTCFVSMPVGRRPSQTGALLDFDRIYAELVAPAIERANLTIRSWRDSSAGASIQKQALGDIMSSDILLADVSTANPNVMYELGVRHAANRGPTVLMCATSAQLPFYVAFLQSILYDPVDDLANPEPIRSRLVEALRAASRRAEGSPLYEFFPGLRVELPPDLHVSDRARAYPEQAKRRLARRSPTAAPRQRAEVRAAEEELRGTDDVSPAAYLDLLRAYRDASDWDGLIRAASDLPPAVADDPQVLQLTALALNRRSQPGDQERAVGLMRRLVDETGGDAETFGILGRIYKDRWRATNDRDALENAIACYRRGFELQPTDYYTGFNAAALLFMQNEPSADAELSSLLPKVKAVLQERLASEKIEYWELSVAIEIAVMEHDWAEARSLLERALALQPPAWSRMSSVESLERLGRRLEGADAVALQAIVESLHTGVEQEYDEYA